MDAGEVTTRQAAIIHARLVETERYLAKLRNRMMEIGFTADDRLFRKVYQSQIALHDLIEELHDKAYGGYSTRGKPR